MKFWTSIAAGALLFALAATANSGGYRYGISDQAFYVPAIALTLDPTLFARDVELLGPQVRMWPGRHVFAGVARAFSLDMPALFALVYLVTLAVLFAAAIGLGRALGLSEWAVAAFVVLLTLRHQIARTGANSLEGYLHPRMLAFAIGVAGLAWLVRRRLVAAWAAVVLAALVHPTTAIWFGVVVAVATLVAPGPAPKTTQTARIFGALAAAGAAVLVMLTVMRPDFTVMDAAWRGVIREKSYLIAWDWPASAWIINLAYPVVIALIYRRRHRAGRTGPAEPAMVIGLFALVAAFLLSVAPAAAGIAAVVQLQVPRVFWLLDVVTAAYVAWWLVDDLAARRARAVRVAIVAGLAVVSAARGYYVLRIEADRPIARVSLAPDDWTDVMTWLGRQPASWHVLADPGHAWLFGSSVRVASLRDTMLEAGKDTAMALYDRRAAMRVAERAAALAEPLTTARIRALDERYGLDVFVAESAHEPVDRPVLYRNLRFVVYDLR